MASTRALHAAYYQHPTVPHRFTSSSKATRAKRPVQSAHFMSLASGTRLGLYEITGHLGSGGMGEVYRARDTKLGREVAIKVVPEELAREPERLARFEREARLLAALNHGNIATLYGAETEAGTGFLVMELVEGETLAERIARGPLPVAEALPLLLQIAEGIEAAHAKGVIHRDLKLANIKITGEGVPKILDFGLAKALAPEQSASGDAALSESPTLTLQATRRGEILGTAAYMSPEQARGIESDPRADVWGFGCCLFEALTGKRPFSGEDAAQTLASVLKDEPDWSALPAEVPANVAMLVRRCLEKSRRARLQSIGDARLELVESLAPPARFGPTPRTAAEGRVRVRLWVAAAVALATLALGLAAGAVLRGRGAASSAITEPVHLSIEVPADLDIRMAHEENNLRISRDGSILYVIAGRGSDRQIYTRRLDERSFRSVPGTAGLDDSAFMVSPDGDWVGFYRDRTLWKVKREGGIPVPILRTTNVYVWNAHWGDDGFVYFSTGAFGGLRRVSEDGGEAETLTEPDPGKGETLHGWPILAPGGATVLFVVVTTGGEYRLEALSLSSGQRRVLVDDRAEPLYASRKHLVYRMGTEVLAAPFDAENARLTGAGIPVLTDIETNPFGNFIFGLSESGTLAYLPRRGIHDRRLVWKDRTGASEPFDREARPYGSMQLAPDGATLAISRESASRWEIVTLDLRRSLANPLTTDSFDNRAPVFSPDGRQIALASNRAGGKRNIFVIDLHSGGEPRRLHSSPLSQRPTSWSSDGNFLAYREITPAEDSDLWALPVDGPEPSPFPIANSPSFESHATFAPGGRWVAYDSERSGRSEIYVARFDGENRSVGRPEPVSSDGGWLPVWSRDGRELYFRNANGSAIMKVDVLRTEPELELGSPQVLFEEREMFAPHRWSSSVDYDVAPDGRFLMLVQARPPQQTIHVVLNWLEELERLVPTK